MDENEFFFRLTPDRVLAAVEAGGFAPTGHCTALNALENRVMDLRLEDGSHVVAKFYRPGRWSREAILDEHRLLFALRDAEIPVCAPLRFPDGQTLHEVAGIHYAVRPRTGGRSPDELTDAEVAVLGRLLARIHNVGEALALEHRPRLDSEHTALASLATLEEGDFLPPSCARRYGQAVRELVSLYDAWSAGVPVHAIHGDCHGGNLLSGDEGFFFLDFDDLTIGPAVHDVWMLLPGRDVYAARQRQLLIEGYREFRPFDDAWLRLVEPLRGYRFVFYAAWIARRYEDPAFPDAFPHFGTETYWETETRDLEELVERIHRGAGAEAGDGDGGGSASSEPELTNKDFFWDL
ncbi:MAG: serine/threonine protein kinase [Proteobacteria bacterium]|nr:serine/threonine protein kinase [Pseudomonadota bacterium]